MMGSLLNVRRGGRSPPLLMVALIACILLFGFNYWVSSSRNLELQTKLLELEEAVRRVSVEKSREQVSRNAAEEEVQRQTEQLALLEAAHQRRQQSAQSMCKQEKEGLLLNITTTAKTLQNMKNQMKSLYEDLTKVQKELQSCQTNMNTLNKKLTYDMTQCNTQILAQKEECDEKLAVAKLAAQKKYEKQSPAAAGVQPAVAVASKPVPDALAGNDSTKIAGESLKKKGLETEHQKEEGLEIEHQKEEGLETEHQKEEELDTEHQKEEGLETEHQKEEGLETKYQKEEGLETKHLEEEGLETKHQKEEGLETKHLEEEGLETEHLEEEAQETEHQGEEGLEIEPLETEPKADDHLETNKIPEGKAALTEDDDPDRPELTRSSSVPARNGTHNSLNKAMEDVMDIKEGDLNDADSLLDEAAVTNVKDEDAIEYDNEGEIEKRLSKLKDDKAAFEEELADYNGDDENEPEFEADKQAELAKV